jgi:hypothetical protein
VQTMVVRYYLEEDVVEVYGGFQAEYVRIGSRANALGAERIRLILKRGKSKEVAVVEMIDDADEVIYEGKDKASKKARVVKESAKKNAKSKPQLIDFIDCDDLLGGGSSETSSFDYSSPAEPKSTYNNGLTKEQKVYMNQWIYEFRKMWNAYWNYINNEAATAIIEMMPTSKQELAAVPGVGESKVNIRVCTL